MPSVEEERLKKAARFTLEDAAMILLALVSGTIVLADIFYRPLLIYEGVPTNLVLFPTEGWADAPGLLLRDPIGPLHLFWWIVIVDAVITGIFILEFFVKAREYGSLGAYARDNWFDVAGIFPMALFVAMDMYLFGCDSLALLAGCQAAKSIGIVRFLRFARIIRIFTAASRLARAANMTFGEQVVSKVFNKYKAILVAELTTPILLQAITITQAIITRGKYAASIGTELDKKRDEIHALILKNLEAKKATAPLVAPEFVREAMRRAEKEVLDTVVLTLTSDELNRIIQDTIDRVLEDFKRELKKKDWAHAAFAGDKAAPAEGAPGTAPQSP